MTKNQLYFGDNLHVLREHIGGESVDLIYLDPPFNSKRDYNIMFESPKGHSSDAQSTDFDDTWHWGEQAEREFAELLHQPNTDVAEMMRALRKFLGENDMMAYLTLMANRLLELRRVLKPTGSLYLHCDPTASHYLKIVLDGVFGKENFRNELIWQRSGTKAHAFTRFPSTHDVILLYGKTDSALWHTQYIGHREEYLESHYGSVEPEAGRIVVPEKGGVPRFKRYLDEMLGTPVTAVWTDIPPINSQAQERLGYPTQKTLALLERIISASSNEGDIVLDPFCGCGTAVHAAQKLNRGWIGIDITHLAISLIEKRLRDAFPGIDGLIFFQDDKGEAKKIIVSVKGGENVGISMIRDLKGTVEREGAELGLFVTLVPPTKPMETEAVSAGFYESQHFGQFPRIQILTIEGLMRGTERARYQDLAGGGQTFKKARSEKKVTEQREMFNVPEAAEKKAPYRTGK